MCWFKHLQTHLDYTLRKNGFFKGSLDNEGFLASWMGSYKDPSWQGNQYGMGCYTECLNVPLMEQTKAWIGWFFFWTWIGSDGSVSKHTDVKLGQSGTLKWILKLDLFCLLQLNVKISVTCCVNSYCLRLIWPWSELIHFFKTGRKSKTFKRATIRYTDTCSFPSIL